MPLITLCLWVRNTAADDPNSVAFIVITSPTDNSFLYFAIIDPVTEKVEFAGKDWT